MKNKIQIKSYNIVVQRIRHEVQHIRRGVKLVRRLWDFIKYNGEKKMTIKAYFYAAYFRLCILILNRRNGGRLEKMLGQRGEESPYEETREHYYAAKQVSRHVNRIAEHTPWESKCMVRAMTAQKLLNEKGIETTIYLGVGINEQGGMRAHAWLRCGAYCVTGDGDAQCIMVAKFKK